MLYDVWRRHQATQKRTKNRDKRRVRSYSGFPERFITQMVLQKTPWSVMRAIAASRRFPATMNITLEDLSKEKIKEISIQTVAKFPHIRQDVANLDLPATLAVKRAIMECELAVWCYSQNARGTVVPGSVLVERYLDMWGMGPHRELLSRHISLLRQPWGASRWVQLWKGRWGFRHAAAARGAGVETLECEKKAWIENDIWSKRVYFCLPFLV